MRQLIAFATFLLLLAACGTGPRPEQTAVEPEQAVLSQEEQGFLDNLASLCGKSFRGQETFMAEGRESWAHMDFIMHVTVCEEDRVHIPFHLDQDQSRTWMFLVEDERLRFRHDHRYPDGTPEAQTLYGGYADGKGTAFRQHFPADEYTIDLLHDTLNRQWNIVMDEEMTNFSYQLQYHGEIVFQADFDLTQPLE